MAPRKKSEAQPQASIPLSSIQSFLMNRWLWFCGFIAALAVLLTNVNSILSNVRALPGEVRKTSGQFFDWYGEYDKWKGHWTSHPEGFVDLEDYHLSDEDFRIEIDVTKDGEIIGSIETMSICDKIPYFDTLMIDGSISSSRNAEIVAFDFVGGHRANFAKIKLIRDNDIITAHAINDPMGIVAKDVRIAAAPKDSMADPPAALCGDKGWKFISEALKDSPTRKNLSTTERRPLVAATDQAPSPKK